VLMKLAGFAVVMVIVLAYTVLIIAVQIIARCDQRAEHEEHHVRWS